MTDKGTPPAAASSPTSPAPKRVRTTSPKHEAQNAARELTPPKPHADELPSVTESSTATELPAQEPATVAADAAPRAHDEEPVTDDDIVEADDDDGDSAFGTDNSDTTSIASSMFAGYLENGRRYQIKREGEYWGPSDEKQFYSMRAAHIMCLILDSKQPNNLFHSPVPDTVQNILDVGTGSGQWAVDVAERFPSSYVQGVDLYPPPEAWVPPNCKFEVDDVLKPWFFQQKFGLVHMGSLVGAFTDDQWRGVYKQAYESLEPGGWIEQLEPSLKMSCDDGTMNPTGEASRWYETVGAAFNASGKRCDTFDHMKDRIEAAGFTNIHEKVYKCPVGEWAKHPILKEAGKYNKIVMLDGMEGYAIFLLTRFGKPTPWTPEEVQVYLAKARQEFSDPNVHIYYRVKRVWAQKPY